jgi:hypothetical protein
MQQQQAEEEEVVVVVWQVGVCWRVCLVKKWSLEEEEEGGGVTTVWCRKMLHHFQRLWQQEEGRHDR